MKKKSKPTQADLDAANAEARGYLDQVQQYRRAEQERDAAALREQDRFVLESFCRVMEECQVPPNVCAVAAWSLLDRSKASMLQLWVGDLKRTAEAVKRMLNTHPH